MLIKLIKVAVLAILFGMGLESIAQNNNDKPNFLFILVEELGYMDVDLTIQILFM